MFIIGASPPSSKGKQKGPSGPTTLDKDTVYLEDIDNSFAKTPAKSKDTQPSPVSSTKKNRFRDHDPYKLPEVNLEEQVAKVTRTRVPDARLATEEELRAFIEEMRPDDFDVTSRVFRELPTEVQYEIVGDLRLKSRQTSYTRLQNMLRKAETPLDFSKEQIKNLQQRNALTQQLLVTTDSIGKAHINIPVRIASERNKEYVLIKNESAEGGWVLGLRDEGSQSRPIEVDADGGEESDGDMEMEEVSMYVVQLAYISMQPLTILFRPEPRRSQPQPSVTSNQPGSRTTRVSRTPGQRRVTRLFDLDEDDDLPRLPSEDINDDDDDPELAIAIQASLETHSGPDVSLVVPFSRKTLRTPPSKTAPLASAESPNVRNVLSRADDIEDLYESPSRLETVLAIAGAGPPRKSSGTFLARTSSSAFGKPGLLVSPGTATRPLAPTPSMPTSQDLTVTEKEVRSVLIGESVLSKTYSSMEKLPNTVPVASPSLGCHTLAADPEPSNSDSDDDMEEIVVGNPSISSVKSGSNPPTNKTDDQGRQENEERVSLPPSPLPPSRATPIESISPEERDDGSVIEWSWSPSPTGDWTKGADALPTFQPSAENNENWDAAHEMDPLAEAGEFARFISHVKGKDLETVRHEIDEEIRVLNQQKKTAMRDSDDITQHMITQIMVSICYL